MEKMYTREVKLLGIAGSPRRGNTEILVREALEGAKEIEGVEVEFISLHGKKINPCLACGACTRDNKLCIQKDDMQPIYPKFIEADGIIIGTPVYMHTVSAQIKALMDRTSCLIQSDFIPDFAIKVDRWQKVGGAIAVGHDRHGGEEEAIQIINSYFLTLNFVVVSGYSPTSYIGCAACQMGSERDSVKKDELGMRAARQVGERVAKTAKLINAGINVLGWKYIRTPLVYKEGRWEPKSV